jgi:hypothetical protein
MLDLLALFVDLLLGSQAEPLELQAGPEIIFDG